MAGEHPVVKRLVRLTAVVLIAAALLGLTPGASPSPPDLPQKGETVMQPGSRSR